ncbi:MAG: phosphatase PAP2 family protein [Patescibacteria group bacterium]
MIEADIVRGIQQAMLATFETQELAVFLARWAIYLNAIPAAILITSRHRKESHSVVEAAWSAVLALALTTCISLLVGRLRPYMTLPDVWLLIPPPLNLSFPSGHTATAVAMACAFFTVRRDLGYISFAVAALVAFGRIAAGAHYPTDILGGILVGYLSFAIVRLIHQQLNRRDLKVHRQKT